MSQTRFYLYINTVTSSKAEVSLVDSQGSKVAVVKFIYQYQFQVADQLLKTVNKVLEQKKKELKNLNGIIIVTHSEKMTALRIGVSLANALAYSLDIPALGISCPDDFLSAVKKINKLKKTKIVFADYRINPMLAN